MIPRIRRLTTHLCAARLTDGTSCPLCSTMVDATFFQESARRYFRCAVCDLIFLHPDNRPLPLDEARRYMEHENHAGDAGYVQFLRTLADPMRAATPVGSRGLDFGCGPAPVLAEILSATGRPTRHYDPLFFPDESLLVATYDFVTCSEVVEHAHDPADLFWQLTSLVRPHGKLAVMTRWHDANTEFDRWWYRRDLTHVCFYSAETMQWIAVRFGYRVELPAPNVAMFTRGLQELSS